MGRGFMINYNLYRHYFPLMALSRARSRISRLGREEIKDLLASTSLNPLETGFVNNPRRPHRGDGVPRQDRSAASDPEDRAAFVVGTWADGAET